MKIFLDTADVKQVQEAWSWGTIDGATTNQTHVLEAALAGAQICTMSMDVLQQLYQHPLTDIGIEMFLNDWKKVPKQ